MTVELRPFRVRCNIRCEYCYQNPQRDVNAPTNYYDIDAMKKAVEKEGGPFTLFGGEPLLIPRRDLEELWAWGLEKYGSNSIQTNGVLITADHIRMFKQYKVSVGISIDGPGELNDIRWAGSLPLTRSATAKTEAAIEMLCREGIPPSLIITLHRGNATAARLPAMADWFRLLEVMGVTVVRLHILEVDDPAVRARWALSIDENIATFMHFADQETKFKRLSFDVFKDMRNLLMGRDREVTCVWRACDPYTTDAVRGVEGTGQRTNCGRTNKDGIDFSKGDSPGFERYVALYNTPQENGGCRGCRFFLMCKGQCPGTAIDGDWRNRTEYCEVWKTLFAHCEACLLQEGKTPLSMSASREAVELSIIDGWCQGRNPLVQDTLLPAARA